MNDCWGSAHCGLLQVSPVALILTGSLAIRRLCGCAEDVNLQPRLEPIYGPHKDERPRWPEHVQESILPKDVRHWHWCMYRLSSVDELVMPDPESDVLTTGPTRLTSYNDYTCHTCSATVTATLRFECLLRTNIVCGRSQMPVS
jgi:hypothetical protein